MSSKIEITRICEYCGNTFKAKTTVTRYCSHKCNQRGYKKNLKLKKIQQSQTQTIKTINRSMVELQAKEFLSIPEVCSLLGISRTTVWRMAKKGLLKTATFGTRRLILKTSITELFKNNI